MELTRSALTSPADSVNMAPVKPPQPERNASGTKSRRAAPRLTRYKLMFLMAEAVGFEPTNGFPLPVFKTGAFNRSATLPH